MNKIFDYSAIASGIILLLLSVLTFCDVFGRRFLNSPVTGTIELPSGTEMVMPGDNVSVTVELLTPIAMYKGKNFLYLPLSFHLFQ